MKARGEERESVYERESVAGMSEGLWCNSEGETDVAITVEHAERQITVEEGTIGSIRNTKGEL